MFQFPTEKESARRCPRSVHSPAQTQNPQIRRPCHITPTNHYHLIKFGFLRQTGVSEPALVEVAHSPARIPRRDAPRVRFFSPVPEIGVHPCSSVAQRLFCQTMHSPAQIRNPRIRRPCRITPTNHYHLRAIWLRSANRPKRLLLCARPRGFRAATHPQFVFSPTHSCAFVCIRGLSPLPPADKLGSCS